jgi:hypothetical protein
VFQASRAPGVISGLPVPESIFLVFIGALFGYVTGRVTAPVAIMIPIYYSRFGVEAIGVLTFTVLFFSIFVGYILSPVHPCLSVSLEYFKTSYKDVMKVAVWPMLIAIAVTFVFTLLFIGW